LADSDDNEDEYDDGGGWGAVHGIVLEKKNVDKAKHAELIPAVAMKVLHIRKAEGDKVDEVDKVIDS
jgi:hypothetical protein